MLYRCCLMNVVSSPTSSPSTSCAGLKWGGEGVLVLVVGVWLGLDGINLSRYVHLPIYFACSAGFFLLTVAMTDRIYILAIGRHSRRQTVLFILLRRPQFILPGSVPRPPRCCPASYLQKWIRTCQTAPDRPGGSLLLVSIAITKFHFERRDPSPLSPWRAGRCIFQILDIPSHFLSNNKYAGHLTAWPCGLSCVGWRPVATGFMSITTNTPSLLSCVGYNSYEHQVHNIVLGIG